MNTRHSHVNINVYDIIFRFLYSLSLSLSLSPLSLSLSLSLSVYIYITFLKTRNKYVTWWDRLVDQFASHQVPDSFGNILPQLS